MIYLKLGKLNFYLGTPDRSKGEGATMTAQLEPPVMTEGVNPTSSSPPVTVQNLF